MSMGAQAEQKGRNHIMVTTRSTNGQKSELTDVTLDDERTTTLATGPNIEYLHVKPLNLLEADFPIRGTAPYMQARFAAKAMLAMRSKMEQGQQSRSRRERSPRDFDDDYHGAMHLDQEGRNGIPAAAFRNAMIDACRTIGFKMTVAKMSIFVKADMLDAVDGTPLVRLAEKPERTEMPVRNATGVIDIRVRPMWRDWSCVLHLMWDADQFSQTDVLNLLVRAGAQVGIGEGRPFSKDSMGMGFGTFDVG